MEIPVNADGRFVAVDPYGLDVGEGVVGDTEVQFTHRAIGGSAESTAVVPRAEFEALFDDPPFELELRPAP
jgi:hypothetical protein